MLQSDARRARALARCQAERRALRLRAGDHRAPGAAPTRASSRCRSATRAALTPRARRSAGGTASRRSGTSRNSISSHERPSRQCARRPAIGRGARLRVVAAGHRQPVHLRRPVHHPAERRVHTLHRWWRLFGQSYWPKDWSGDGYRPLTMLAFASSGAIGRGSPMVFHADEHPAVRGDGAVSCSSWRSRSCRCGPRGASRRCSPSIRCTSKRSRTSLAKPSCSSPSSVLAATLLVSCATGGPATLRPRTGRHIVRPLCAWPVSPRSTASCCRRFSLAAEVTLIDDAPPGGRARATSARDCISHWSSRSPWRSSRVRARVLSDHGFGGFAPFTPFSSLQHLRAAIGYLTALGVVPQWLRLLFWPRAPLVGVRAAGSRDRAEA